MKIINSIFLGLVILATSCSFFNLFWNSTRSEKSKIAHRISNVLVKNLESKYGLSSLGIGEEGPGEKYIRLAYDFQYPYLLTKDQGRALLVVCMEEAVRTF